MSGCPTTPTSSSMQAYTESHAASLIFCSVPACVACESMMSGTGLASPLESIIVGRATATRGTDSSLLPIHTLTHKTCKRGLDLRNDRPTNAGADGPGDHAAPGKKYKTRREEGRKTRSEGRLAYVVCGTTHFGHSDAHTYVDPGGSTCLLWRARPQSGGVQASRSVGPPPSFPTSFPPFFPPSFPPSFLPSFSSIPLNITVHVQYHRWLEAFQHYPQAWAVADAILSNDSSSAPVLFFAAKTLQTKVYMDWEELEPGM